MDDADYKKALKDEAKIEDRLDEVNSSQQSMLFESQVYNAFPEANSLMEKEMEQVVRSDMANHPESEILGTINWLKSGAWKNGTPEQVSLVMDGLGRAKHQREINRLSQENESLRQGSNLRADEVASKIQKVASQSPVITNGKHSVTKTWGKSELASMDDAAFDEAYKAHMAA